MTTMVYLEGASGVRTFRAQGQPKDGLRLDVYDANEIPLIRANMTYDDAVDLAAAIMTEIGAPDIAEMLHMMKNGYGRHEPEETNPRRKP